MEDTHSDVWCIDINNIVQLLSKQMPLNEDCWQQLTTTGDIPGKISNHRAVSIGSKIYVYGGLINNENQTQSLFSLDVITCQWTKHITKALFFY